MSQKNKFSQRCGRAKVPQICQLPKSANILNFREGANLPIFQKSAYQGFPKHVTLVLERCRHTKVSQRCKRIYVGVPKGANLPSTSKHTIEMQSHVPRIPEHANTSTCPKGVHILSFSKMQQSLYVPKMQTYQSSPKMQTHQGFRGCNCS